MKEHILVAASSSTAYGESAIALASQIELAAELGKPLMIHCRPSKKDDAYSDVLEILKAGNVSGGVIHFFVGSKAAAEEFLKLD